jgi:hypothetical protein
MRCFDLNELARACYSLEGTDDAWDASSRSARWQIERLSSAAYGCSILEQHKGGIYAIFTVCTAAVCSIRDATSPVALQLS